MGGRLVFALVVVMLSSEWTSASGIKVAGRIVDSYDIPASTASIQVYSGDTRLLKVARPVELSGQFSLVLPDFSGAQVRVEITAPGYLTETRNVLVEDGVATVGLVRLKKDLQFVVEPFTHSLSADKKQLLLETFLLNESLAGVEVTSFSIVGTRLTRSSCLDLRPGLIYDIHADAQGALSSATVQDPATKYKEAIALDGKFEQLPCKQQRIDVTIPYRFTLEPKERSKIQIRLPRTVSVGTSSETLDLENWRAVRFGFRLATGAEAYSEFLQ